MPVTGAPGVNKPFPDDDNHIQHHRDLEAAIGTGGPGSAATTSFAPAGTIAATDVQAAVQELDGDVVAHKAATTTVHGIANTALLETGAGAQAKVDTHVNDTTAAHAASSLSASSTTLVGIATDVQGVLEELDDGIANHLADTTAAHAASAISADSTTLTGTGTDVQAVLEELDNTVDAHIVDTTAAHAASSISADSTTLAGVGTTVQAVLEELDDAIAVSGIPGTIFGAKGQVLGASANDTPTIVTAPTADWYALVGNSLAADGSGLLFRYVHSAPREINTQTGTTYTLVLADAGKVVTLNNAAAITLTVPTNASVAYPIGTVIDLAQLGAGQVTIAGGGVTLSTASTLKLRTLNSPGTLLKIATDTWIVLGDLEPLGQAINAQTGTTYTLVIGDAWKFITLSNASAIALTVPTNASVPFPIGTHIDLGQLGAGQVTVSGAGVTFVSTPTLKLRATGSPATLIKTATDTWWLTGDLAAA